MITIIKYPRNSGIFPFDSGCPQVEDQIFRLRILLAVPAVGCERLASCVFGSGNAVSKPSSKGGMRHWRPGCALTWRAGLHTMKPVMCLSKTTGCHTQAIRIEDMDHCCQRMVDEVGHTCDEHSDAFDCPDSLILYESRFDEYGIIIHDGGTSYVTIAFCPFCGTKLPESKRDLWFDTLEAMGVSDPLEGGVPEEFKTDEWFRGKKRES
jgi:hypothetical protein